MEKEKLGRKVMKEKKKGEILNQWSKKIYIESKFT
jgi:hypothetical protein